MSRILLTGVLGALFITRVTAVEVVQVDIHDRLYPDRWPTAVEPAAISIPRGAPVMFQFAVRANKEGLAKLGDDCKVPGKTRIHWLQAVHVEGNTQGSLKNRPGGEVPQGWMDHLVRAAPFDTLEVLVEGDRMPIVAGRTHGVVVELAVPRDAAAGMYKGRLQVTLGNDDAVVPFSYRVHESVLPSHHALHATHWLSPDPVDLTSAAPPEWWSERHWELLAQAGSQLRAFGDDTMFTPLIGGEHPLISVTQLENGAYTFDYTRFDRWVTLFRGQGFRLFAGWHLNGRGRSVFIRNEQSGRVAQSFLKDPGQEAWMAFLPVFLRDYHKHLKDQGWLDCFLQHQYDEPKDEVFYAAISGAVRENLPGVGSIDAINNRPETFSPLVDHLVFNLPGLLGHAELAAARVAERKHNWLYHCTSPYPPYPNRHIDSPLTESRLWPWMCAAHKAQGFLFWAANLYRGTEDEYARSLGPMGPLKAGAELRVGHPPGDNWFYYRGPEGLRPSVRILAFREGLVDHTLLSMLAQRDPERARALQDRIVADVVRRMKPHPKDWSWSRYPEQVNYFEATYSRTPGDYHAARAEILDALEKQD